MGRDFRFFTLLRAVQNDGGKTARRSEGQRMRALLSECQGMGRCVQSDRVGLLYFCHLE